MAILSLCLLVCSFLDRKKFATFLCVLVCAVFYGFYKAPFLVNHAFLYFFTSLFLLWQCSIFVLKNRNASKIEFESFFLFVKPSLCLALAGVYFIAGFHKLNASFFDVRQSCAVIFTKDLLGSVSLASFSQKELTMLIAPYLIVGIEILGAFFLLLRSTRKIALIMVFVFHLMLSLLSFVDFSMVCLALLFCFYSLPRKLEAIEVHRLNVGLGVLSAACILISIVGYVHRENRYFFTNHSLLQGSLFVLGALFFVITFVFLSTRTRPQFVLSSWTHFKKKSQYALPSFILLWGTMNYFGLRTVGNFSMFSNLRTEVGASNHFLVPVEVQLFDYQKNLVFIKDIELEKNALDWHSPRVETYLTEFELARAIQEWTRQEIAYSIEVDRLGKIVSIDSNNWPTWLKPPSYLEKKILQFRFVSDQGSQASCSW
ncbi:HTTM domain-containing protein [bacterium]|nr:HTTM domain-containing protein [bacterium]